MRLDTCSLEDALAGKAPVEEIEEIWMRLTISARGADRIRALQKEDPLRLTYVCLFLWNQTMRLELEQRVFRPPIGLEIAAVS